MAQITPQCSHPRLCVVVAARPLIPTPLRNTGTRLTQYFFFFPKYFINPRGKIPHFGLRIFSRIKVLWTFFICAFTFHTVDCEVITTYWSPCKRSICAVLLSLFLAARHFERIPLALPAWRHDHRRTLSRDVPPGCSLRPS